MAACGSGSDKADTVGGGHHDEKAANAFGHAGDLLTPARIGAVLPSAKDVGKGWTRDPSEENNDEQSSDKVTPKSCESFSNSDDWTGKPDAKNEHYFKKDDFGPFFFTSIESYKEPVTEAAMNKVVDMLGRCSTTTSIDKDGNKSTMSLTPLDFPNLGQQSFAMHMDVKAMFPVAADIAVIRIGHNMYTVGYMAIGATAKNTAVMEKLAQQTIDRLK
ncbi:hypothetical protein GCM10027076_02510 [Nocardioides montaniterrae]